MSMTAYDTLVSVSPHCRFLSSRARVYATRREKEIEREESNETHARRAKGNPVPIPEPGSGTAYNSGPRKSVRRGNPK